MDSQPRVVIGCPMGEKVLRYEDPRLTTKITKATKFFTGIQWMNSIAQSEYENFEVLINANDLSENNIKQLKQAKDSFPHPITILFTNTGRNTIDERGARKYQAKVNGEKPYEHFAKVRNLVVEHVVRMALEDHTIKYFLSADSDIITHPDTVPRLVEIMESNPDIGMCSIPVNNDRRVTEKTPNGLGWGRAQYNFGEWIIHTPDNPYRSNVRPTKSFPINSGLLSVGYTGAFCIIRMTLLLPPHMIRYDHHMQGEDVPFCHKIKDVGYKMCVDTDQVSLHLQDPRLFTTDRTVFDRRELI
jgi:GT2 family glycosyltransferase